MTEKLISAAEVESLIAIRREARASDCPYGEGKWDPVLDYLDNISEAVKALPDATLAARQRKESP